MRLPAQTDRHAFGDVVQRDGQHHHGAAAQFGGKALGVFAADVQVRHQTVQQHQKRAAQQKSAAHR